MKRILAIDYGLARIGLAISDSQGMFARPLQVIKHIGRAEDARRVAEVACEQGATHLLLGLPYDDDGQVSAQGRTVQRFGNALLEICPLPLVYWDESLSSQEEESLVSPKRVRQQRNKPLDAVAAAVILQDYLNVHSEN